MTELTETEFYNRLAEFFDVMTDWKSRIAFELPFLRTMLEHHHVHTILDCACGTGWHSIELARFGYQVAASDISSEMIQRAQANARREGMSIAFQVARFQDLRSAFQGRFDAVLCLGNSFPHVLDENAATDSLANMHDVLRDGGVLILHGLNYDKRWKDKPRWFAVNSGMLEGKETLVWRFADYAASLITFNIALFTKNAQGEWSVQVQSTLQRPYQKQELQELLSRAGFREMNFYGSLQGESFNPERSGDLVVVAMS